VDEGQLDKKEGDLGTRKKLILRASYYQREAVYEGVDPGIPSELEPLQRVPDKAHAEGGFAVLGTLGAP